MKISCISPHLRSHLQRIALASLCAFGLMLPSAHAESVGTVWYILIENRNFTESETSGGAQIYGNPAAPYINSLITPGNPNAAQVSYCAAYHNVLAVFDGSGPSIHPSEPNYVWMEAGSNLSKLDDNDPYGSGQSVTQIHNFLEANPSYSGQNLSGLLQAAGISWRAYSEETNQLNTGGTNANLGRHSDSDPGPGIGMDGAAGELQRDQRGLREPLQREQPVELRLQAHGFPVLRRHQRDLEPDGRPTRAPFPRTRRRSTIRRSRTWWPTWRRGPARSTT